MSARASAAARALGRLGGRTKSPAKAASSAANGARGGRPALTLRSLLVRARLGGADADAEAIDRLIDAYGGDTRASGPWEVVRSQFHGGSIVSRHRSVVAAVTRARRMRGGECQCGCADVRLASSS
jgi:hypothetical protein